MNKETFEQIRQLDKVARNWQAPSGKRISAFQEIIRLSESDEFFRMQEYYRNALYELGMFETDFGTPNLAIENFTKLLNLIGKEEFMKNEGLCRELGVCLFIKGKYDSALEMLKKAAQNLENNEVVQDFLGLTYIRLTEKKQGYFIKEAIKQVDILQSLNPTSANSLKDEIRKLEPWRFPAN